MSRSFSYSSRQTFCLSALLLTWPAGAFAQTAPAEAPTSPPLQTVSAKQPATPADSPVTGTPAAEPAPSEPFQLPIEQHPWAKFQPGAWRELRIVSETFGDKKQTLSRSVTTQKEVLQQVVEGKYVLKVQATVDLSGKRIVGDWKTRVLHLATDGAGSVVDSFRREDQVFSLAGRTADCQVWEIRYREGDRNLMDRIVYAAQQFPFVLQRETFTNDGPADSKAKEAALQAEQRMELTIPSIPYLLGEQLLECSCLSTFSHREKGDTHRLTFTSSVVPGGDVEICTTDFDLQGHPVRSSVAQLLAYGESLPEGETLLDEADEP